MHGNQEMRGHDFNRFRPRQEEGRSSDRKEDRETPIWETGTWSVGKAETGLKQKTGKGGEEDSRIEKDLVKEGVWLAKNPQIFVGDYHMDEKGRKLPWRGFQNIKERG